jgi:hypothetical protein
LEDLKKRAAMVSIDDGIQMHSSKNMGNERADCPPRIDKQANEPWSHIEPLGKAFSSKRTSCVRFELPVSGVFSDQGASSSIWRSVKKGRVPVSETEVRNDKRSKSSQLMIGYESIPSGNAPQSAVTFSQEPSIN